MVPEPLSGSLEMTTEVVIVVVGLDMVMLMVVVVALLVEIEGVVLRERLVIHDPEAELVRVVVSVLMRVCPQSAIHSQRVTSEISRRQMQWLCHWICLNKSKR